MRFTNHHFEYLCLIPRVCVPYLLSSPWYKQVKTVQQVRYLTTKNTQNCTIFFLSDRPTGFGDGKSWICRKKCLEKV